MSCLELHIWQDNLLFGHQSAVMYLHKYLFELGQSLGEGL